MKQNNSPAVRAMYIVLIPVIAVMLLLNSGLLQRLLPAATVNGERYTVVQYNYYYFSCYNEFLETHEHELDNFGYDPETSASEQLYDETTTWEDHFLSMAEHSLTETAYFYDLAQQNSYRFSDEELAPIQEQLDQNTSVMELYGLSAKNYYVSYFGSGMTEELYTEELTRDVKASAYREHLLETMTPDEAELQGWLEANPGKEFSAVNLRVITLEAIPERGTGKVGQPQLDAMSHQLSRLSARFDSGTDFSTLQQQFSTCAIGNGDGLLSASFGSELPDELRKWCVEDQDSLTVGDTFTAVDDETGTGYFTLFSGFSGDGRLLEATHALNADRLMELLTAAQNSSYRLTRSAFGMNLAAS